MNLTEDVGLQVGMDSMIDALHESIGTRFVPRGHDVRDSLINTQEASEAWRARGKTEKIERGMTPDPMKDREGDSGDLTSISVIPPTPAPPPVPWIWIEEADGSRTLHTTFTMVKDEHPSGKRAVDIRMKMLPGGPFSTAAAIGIALAAENVATTL